MKAKLRSKMDVCFEDAPLLKDIKYFKVGKERTVRTGDWFITNPSADGSQEVMLANGSNFGVRRILKPIYKKDEI